MLNDNMISVIVPVYNVEKYLKKCIDSLINQTYSNLEIILINDGSTDNSGIICDKYMSIDQRIKVIHQQNKGVSAARNAGLKIARGDYITFVDSDDWLENNAYSVLVADIQDNSADAVFCGYKIFDEFEELLRIVSPQKQGIVKMAEALYQILGMKKKMDYYGTAPWNKLIRKDYIVNLLFDEKLNELEDGLFLVEAIQRCTTVYLESDPLINYRIRKNSISHKEGISRAHVDKIIAYEEIKGKIVQNKKLYNIVNSCMFNYAVRMLSEAYITGEKTLCNEILEYLAKAEKDGRVFYCSSIKSALKSCALLFCIGIKMNRNIVKKIACIYSS